MNPAAFFDLDGTLIPSPSLELRMVRNLLRRGDLGAAQAVRWLNRFLRCAARDWFSATAGNKTYLAGVSAEALEGSADEGDTFEISFYEQGLDALQRHAALGHRIVLVSGTLAPLASRAARELERGLRLHAPVLVIATELECIGQMFTGETAGPHLLVRGKSRAVRRVAAQERLDLRASFAYGNTAADAGMLECTGHPVAVNPDFTLRRRAQQEGWPILQWHGAIAAHGIEHRQAGPPKSAIGLGETAARDSHLCSVRRPA